MSRRNFSLEPHPAGPVLHGVRLTGSIERLFNALTVSYELSGALADILIPFRADIPLRRTGLWESTCFELFLAPPDDSHYWEFNLSPSEHWNVFRFTSYRQGMEEEPSFDFAAVSTRTLPDSFLMKVDWDLGKIVPDTRTLQFAVSAVLQHKDGELSFWALNHGGPRADFHRRDGFVIEI